MHNITFLIFLNLLFINMWFNYRHYYTLLYLNKIKIKAIIKDIQMLFVF